MQGRNLGTEADAEALESAAYCLALLGLFLMDPSYRTQTTSSGLALPTMGWALSYQSLINKMPAAFFLTEVPSSKMTLACVKLTQDYAAHLCYQPHMITLFNKLQLRFVF